jgi:hypothetical protein
LGPNLKIFHINVEDISISKSEYLARLMQEGKEDIIVVQETHVVSEENLQRRGTMPGYVLGRFTAPFTALQETLRGRFLTVVLCLRTIKCQTTD